MTALKLRSKVNFPATVTATGGLAVAKANGIWTVEPDWSYLSLETVIPDASGRQLWTYDPAAGTYYRLSVQALIDNLPAGPPGSAATIAAGTTTTGKAGTNASVTNSGTSSAAVFDVTVPRGADAGMRYNFETSTSMAAPASGGIRLNNASLASVTAIAVNASDAGGIDVSDFVATWDDSTNAVKGYVEVRKEGSGAALGLFSIASVTDNTSWLQISVSYVSGSGSFSASDPVYLVPYRTGNKGADGAGTGDFSSNTATSVVNEVVLFSDTGGKTGKRATGTGIAKLTSGVLGTATSGTDYAPATTGSSILKASAGGFANATAGTDYCAATSGSSVLKGASGNTTAATAGTDFMKPDTTSALTAGFTATSYSGGTVTGSGQTYTPAAANGNYQHITLNGSSLTGTFTFAVPSSVTSIVVEVANGGSGAVGATLSTSGYTKVTGDTYATTNGNKYLFCITKSNSYSHLHIQALQ